jgi:alpha-ketoglutarate-dependent 2,4-dichlorophenoxyacetate dioxygenase
MSLDIQPVHPLFGGRIVSRVDLRQPLSSELVHDIDTAMKKYGVLVFSDQLLDPDQLVAVGSSFGHLDLPFAKAAKRATRHHAKIADIANIDPDTGEVAARDHRKIIGSLANQIWHADGTFGKPMCKYSFLSAAVLPDWGGQTEFCDLRVAYDTLPPAVKEEVAPLQAEHYFLHSRLQLGDSGYTEEQRNATPPVHWPLVRQDHPSGRKVLFVGGHASHVVGWPVAEGRLFISDLIEHATQKEFVYRHEWKVGDLVVWDNRCTLHRGRRYDLSIRRELRRVSTMDLETAAAH